MMFYRCILCGTVVSQWDIRERHGCPRCGQARVRMTNLSLREKVVQLVKHPKFWRWHAL